MKGGGPSLALQQVQDNIWKSQAGPAKHSTKPLSIPVKLPPAKLWIKWKTLPWLPKRDLLKKKKKKSLLKSQNRTPKTTQVIDV